MAVIGIDASKGDLVLGVKDETSVLRNEAPELAKWSQTLPKDTLVGIEATGRYHRPVLAALHRAGIRSYLLNPMHVSRYARALRPTLKTDKSDAKIIARYLERESDMLVEYKMPSEALQELKDLLSFRETLMEKRVSLKQSLSEQTFKLDSLKDLDKGFKEMILEVDKKIKDLAKLHPLYKRMISIDGVGPLGAAALTWLFESHDFRDSDQAVSFIGLDVSIRQSGKFVGKSKLTKRGPAFVRTFLFNGANCLRKLPELQPLFDHHQAKKLSKTAVNVIVARKLTRIAYALATQEHATFERENMLPRLT
jgi:transposase